MVAYFYFRRLDPGRRILRRRLASSDVGTGLGHDASAWHQRGVQWRRQGQPWKSASSSSPSHADEMSATWRGDFFTGRVSCSPMLEGKGGERPRKNRESSRRIHFFMREPREGGRLREKKN